MSPEPHTSPDQKLSSAPPSPPRGRRRIGRRVAIAAAAFVVCAVPTACDYPGLGQISPPADSSYGTGSGGHAGHGAPAGAAATTAPVVVPVGNNRPDPEAGGSGAATTGAEAPETTQADAADPTAAPGGDNGDNNNGDADNGNDNGDDNGAGGDGTAAPTRDQDAPATQTESPAPGTDAPETTTAAPAPTTEAPAPPAANNGLDVLGRDCTGSSLEPHTGFQVAPACVSTEFGEVASEDKSPSLLITDAPKTVATGETFKIDVSTRNLVRDRFLGAAAGGYYLESSFLNADGLQRGHFHTACRMLESTSVAPDAAPAPAFFLATQDNGGGAAPDTVTVTVQGGLPTAGTAQCTVWAGDGSHRIPMMQRANQTPAVDSVRITIQ